MKDTKGFKAYLCLLLVVSVIGALFSLIRVAIPPESKDPVMLILGALLMRVADMCSFYFGSSEGSQRKTELLKGANNDIT